MLLKVDRYISNGRCNNICTWPLRKKLPSGLLFPEEMNKTIQQRHASFLLRPPDEDNLQVQGTFPRWYVSTIFSRSLSPSKRLILSNKKRSSFEHPIIHCDGGQFRPERKFCIHFELLLFLQKSLIVSISYSIAYFWWGISSSAEVAESLSQIYFWVCSPSMAHKRGIRGNVFALGCKVDLNSSGKSGV